MKNKNFLSAIFVQPETDLNRLKLTLLLVHLTAFDSEAGLWSLKYPVMNIWTGRISSGIKPLVL